MILREQSVASRKHYYYTIYKDSQVLNLLFYLLDPKDMTLADFAKSQFLSLATCYRLKQKCLSFLKEAGLSIYKNKINGPEYRIRFLIALLDYRFGFSMYQFDTEDLELVDQLIMATNTTVSESYFKKSPDEYYFFSYLIALTWKRHHLNVKIPTSKEFDALKLLFVYPEILKIQNKCKNQFDGLLLSKNDADYIFLVYCLTNSPLFKDRWSQTDINNVIDLVYGKTSLKSLINAFTHFLGQEITQQQDFSILMIFLMKRFLFSMHALIPTYETFEYKQEENKEILFELVDQIISEWMIKENYIGNLDKHLIYLLTLQIGEVIKDFIEPVKVYVFSNNRSNLNTITAILKRNFTSLVPDIRPVNLLTELYNHEIDKERSIIIASQQYMSYLKDLYHQEEHLFVNISLNFHVIYQNNVYNAIYDLREEKYQRFIQKLQQKKLTS